VLNNNFFEQRNGVWYVRTIGTPIDDILDAKRKGQSDSQVLENFAGLRRAELDNIVAAAYTLLEYCPEFRLNTYHGLNRKHKKTKGVTFFLDECTTYRALEKLVNKVSKITHNYIENMAGAKDIEIWDRAKKGDWNVIVTKDSDFVDLAVGEVLERVLIAGNLKQARMTNTPFVVQVKGEHIDHPVIVETLKDNSALITRESRNPARKNSHAIIHENGSLELVPTNKSLAHYIKIDKETKRPFTLICREGFSLKKLNKLREGQGLPKLSGTLLRSFEDAAAEEEKLSAAQSEITALAVLAHRRPALEAA
jgi:predicted nuclease of predicted toxin-antitoxin system/uncharacterized protein (DUF433 family)